MTTAENTSPTACENGANTWESSKPWDHLTPPNLTGWRRGTTVHSLIASSRPSNILIYMGSSGVSLLNTRSGQRTDHLLEQTKSTLLRMNCTLANNHLSNSLMSSDSKVHTFSLGPIDKNWMIIHTLVYFWGCYRVIE